MISRRDVSTMSRIEGQIDVVAIFQKTRKSKIFIFEL